MTGVGAAGATAEREQFERDGYTVFRSVIDAGLVAEAQAHVDWLQARHPELRPEHLGHELVADDPFWVRLIGDDRLLDVAARFIGDDIALFASHYISKPPFDGQPVLWPQDASYGPLDPGAVVTLWLAVDDAHTDNGCLRVIPGSHQWPVHRLRRRDDVESVLSTEIDADIDESAAVDLELRAGDVEVHHPNIVHGSHANTSDRRRCGLTIRYIPASTRIVTPGEEPWPCAFLLRGSAVPGVNRYVDRPAFDPSRHFPFRGCRAG